MTEVQEKHDDQKDKCRDRQSEREEIGHEEELLEEVDSRRKCEHNDVHEEQSSIRSQSSLPNRGIRTRHVRHFQVGLELVDALG